MYLAEKTCRLMPADLDGRYEVIQWLMFQIAYSGDCDRPFRPNVTGHSARSAL